MATNQKCSKTAAMEGFCLAGSIALVSGAVALAIKALCAACETIGIGNDVLQKASMSVTMAMTISFMLMCACGSVIAFKSVKRVAKMRLVKKTIAAPRVTSA